MTIYILEVPHRSIARCWSAIDEQDAMDRTEAAHSRSGGVYDYLARTGEAIPFNEGEGQYEREATFEEVMDMNGSNLHAQYIFMSDDEALKALHTNAIQGHQRYKAILALHEELERNGVDVSLVPASYSGLIMGARDYRSETNSEDYSTEFIRILEINADGTAGIVQGTSYNYEGVDNEEVTTMPAAEAFKIADRLKAEREAQEAENTPQHQASAAPKATAPSF